MRCHYHPEREAVATCGNCGRGTCVECTIIEGGRWYCPRCYRLEAVSEYDSQTALPDPTGDAPTVKTGGSGAWKTIVAAILMLLASLFSGITSQFYVHLGIPVIPSMVFTVGFPVAGAIYTFLEKSFIGAMVGAICATFSMPLFGILAGILVWQSRSRFA